MSMCRVFSCVVVRGCLLWPVRSLGKPLLAFALLHFVLQGQFACYSWYLLTSYFCIQSPVIKRAPFWGISSRRSVGLHRTVQLQLLQHYWLGQRLQLLWYWMVCFGNKERSFYSFWDCTQILHFRLFCWLWGLLYFFCGILPHNGRFNGHLS